MESLFERRSQALLQFVKTAEWEEMSHYFERILAQKSFQPRIPFTEDRPSRILAGIYALLDKTEDFDARNKFARNVILLYSSEVNVGNRPANIFELLDAILSMSPRVKDINILLTDFREKRLKAYQHGSINLHDQLLATLCHIPTVDRIVIREEILRNVYDESILYKKAALRYLYLNEFTAQYEEVFENILVKFESQYDNVKVDFLVESLFEYAIVKGYHRLYKWIKKNAKTKSNIRKEILYLVDKRLVFPWISNESYAMLAKVKLNFTKTFPPKFICDLLKLFRINIQLFTNIEILSRDEESIEIGNLLCEHLNFQLRTYKSLNYLFEDNNKVFSLDSDFLSNNKNELKSFSERLGLNEEALNEKMELTEQDFWLLKSLSASLPINSNRNFTTNKVIDLIKGTNFN